GGRARERPRLRPLVGDLHQQPHVGLPLSRADLGGHGLDQQLDLRRRGAPPLRRQRQVGQRLAPVGRLGPRPVHALAVGQLGLRGQAAEGADGRGRRVGRPGVPSRGSGTASRRPGVIDEAAWLDDWNSAGDARIIERCEPAIKLVAVTLSVDARSYQGYDGIREWLHDVRQHFRARSEADRLEMLTDDALIMSGTLYLRSELGAEMV